MNSQFRVTKSSRWPSGDYRAAAVVRLEPGEFTARLAIRFARGLDTLDYYRAVTLVLASGRRVDLVQYRGNRDHGTEVLIDSADDPGEALSDMLGALQLSADVVSWTPQPMSHARSADPIVA